MSKIWYPYTQHQLMQPPLNIDSAQGVHLHLDSGDTLIDAVSSWWSVIHGYKHPRLDAAITEQLDQMAHVMLGGLTHNAAKDLSELLVKITPGDINHVFFADSGSVGIEVALKLSIQYWKNKNKANKHKIISFKQAYHGDTTGAMAVSDPDDSFHHSFKGLLLEQLFLEAPSDVETDTKALEQCLKANHEQVAAIIIEPLLQAAGGFNIYSADFLKEIRRLSEQYNVLFICDEVATGFGRTGSLFAVNQADIVPDIMVLGKGLTGGYLGLAATCTRSHIFEAFYSTNPNDAFMHGPTFMGNPLACRVALESVRIFLDDQYLEKIKRVEDQLHQALDNFKHDAVKDTRVLGATGVIEVHDKQSLKELQEYAKQRGVWLRPFENYAYTMPPYIISDDQLNQILDVMTGYFQSSKHLFP